MLFQERHHDISCRLLVSALLAMTPVLIVQADDSEQRGDDEILAQLKSRGADIRKGTLLGGTSYVEIRFRESSWAASSRLLASLRDVKQNVALDFSGIRLDDDDLGQIRGWQNLFFISFKHCTISDGSVRHVATLPNLQELALVGGNMANADLAHVCGHHKLRGLLLQGRGFSDDAVTHLRRMKGLTSIILFSHRFTAKGVAELQKALPDAHISVSSPSFDVPRWRFDKSKAFVYVLSEGWRVQPMDGSPHDAILIPSEDGKRRNIVISDQPGNSPLRELKAKYERDLPSTLREHALIDSGIQKWEDGREVVRIAHTNTTPGVPVRQVNYIITVGERRYFVVCTTMKDDGEKYDKEFDRFVRTISKPID
jgi:hypothetical protein